MDLDAREPCRLGVDVEAAADGAVGEVFTALVAEEEGVGDAARAFPCDVLVEGALQEAGEGGGAPLARLGGFDLEKVVGERAFGKALIHSDGVARVVLFLQCEGLAYAAAGVVLKGEKRAPSDVVHVVDEGAELRHFPERNVAFGGRCTRHPCGGHRVRDGVAHGAPAEECVQLSPDRVQGARSVGAASRLVCGEKGVEPPVDVGGSYGGDVPLAESGKEELHKEAHTFYGSFRCGRRL